MASAPGSCIFTIVGISAREHGFSIEDNSCTITKIMTDSLSRIAEIRIESDLSQNSCTDKQKKIPEQCVRSCPVTLSLHESVIQNVALEL